MNKIEVFFAPCEQPPSKGYIVKYRVQGSSEMYKYAGNFFMSPAIFYDTLNPAGTLYEGFIQADLGDLDCDKVYWPGESGCAGGDAKFVTTTFVSGDSLNEKEVANIFGSVGVTVRITLDTYTNNNGGKLKVNGDEAYINNYWDVVIDQYCSAHLNVEIDGVHNPGTAILGHFTITSVDSGAIGTPDSYQISKAFI